MRSYELNRAKTIIILSKNNSIKTISIKVIKNGEEVITSGKITEGGLGYKYGCCILHELKLSNKTITLVHGDSHLLWERHQLLWEDAKFFKFLMHKLEDEPMEFNVISTYRGIVKQQENV